MTLLALEPVSPFAIPEFFEALGHAGENSTISSASAQGYLSRSFQVRRTWGLFRRLEARGIGVADYTEVDCSLAPADTVTQWWRQVLCSGSAHLLVLPRVRTDSGIRGACERFAEAEGRPLMRLPYDVAPYALLTGRWEDFYGQKGRKFRYNLRRAEARLDAMGGLAFVHANSPAQVAAELDVAFQIYSRRSERRYGSPLWLTEGGRQVLRRMAAAFAVRRWADITVMRVGARPIAFSYGFHNGQDYFFYATAMDGDAQYTTWSPGTLLVKHLLERAFGQGFRRFDFMTGDEPYKRIWATHQEPIFTYLLAGHGPRARTSFLLYSVWLRARQRARRSTRLRAVTGP